MALACSTCGVVTATSFGPTGRWFRRRRQGDHPRQFAMAGSSGRGQDGIARASQRMHLPDAEFGQDSTVELDVARWPDRVEWQVGIENWLDQGWFAVPASRYGRTADVLRRPDRRPGAPLAQPAAGQRPSLATGGSRR
jgi:hypothetical protein